MTSKSNAPLRVRMRGLASVTVLTASLVGLASTTASAAVTTFGSPLSVPATLNTSENLGYYGTFTPVPPNPEAPNGLFHTSHFGADTVLWNTASAVGDPRSPATGQALKVSLEGCAKPASGGASPLTQIHFQDITPLADGGARVNISSQPFDIPVCGRGGASGSTVTSYVPINLCVARGDYVGFNDEGGYVENVFRSGVPYQVIGAVAGSRMNSFLRNNGTGNGATISSHDTSPNDGFFSNPNEELMMQVTLGTGPDATHICSGGTAGLPPPPPPLRLVAQTDGVNHGGMVSVAMYCRSAQGCTGLASLSPTGSLTGYSGRGYGRANFSLPGGHTGHVPIRLTGDLMRRIRKNHGASTLLTVVMGGQTFTQAIRIKIY
jgi:hypothetical protein